jgi:hypothetical protein
MKKREPSFHPITTTEDDKVVPENTKTVRSISKRVSLVVRRMLRPKGQTGGWRKLNRKELCNLYFNYYHGD